MSNPSSRLYRTLWRWHFYAGLFCIPFIISLSITGAIYLFKPQIDRWIDRPYHELTIEGSRSTPQQQISAAQQSLSSANKAKFISYRLPEHKDQAVIITLNHEGQRKLVYVNPYNLEILKTTAYDDQFIQIVRSLHGSLLMGNSGAFLIELAGCWAIVMIITGLYLWWPRNSSGLAGIIYPRLSQGKKKFWRDLHAVTGFWVAFFTLFLLVSGLPWALVWGKAFQELRSLGKPTIQQDWSIGRDNQQTNTTQALHPTSEIVQAAINLNFAHPAELSLDRNNPQQWKLSSRHQNRMLRADAWFDTNTGELVKVQPFSERATIDKVVGIGIAAHEGHLFGWMNQLLGLIVTLGLILVSVSGFILWRKRKPEGVLGAPPIMPNSRVGKTVFITTIALAIVLPVLAISLITLLVLENVVLKRIARLRLWLGLRPSVDM